MAFPKGLPRDLYTKMKAAGTLQAWLVEHKAHTEAGTLEAWMSKQGLSLPTSSGAKPDAPKVAPKARRSVLGHIVDITSEMATYLRNTPLGDFHAEDDCAIGEALASLQDAGEAIKAATRDLEAVTARIEREVALLADLEDKANELDAANDEIEALKARVAEMEQTLKANGHSDKVQGGSKKPKLASVE